MARSQNGTASADAEDRGLASGLLNTSTQLGTALGVLMFAVGSVLFWLHALSKLALLRINVRRAFFIDGADLPRVHRIGTIVMIALYGAVVLVGGVAYLVR